MPRETKKTQTGVRWRLWLGIAGGLLAFATTALAARAVRHYALTERQFLLSHSTPDSITVYGLNYASRWRVQNVFATDFDRSVFAVPLAERRRRLLGIDWIETASVSRILPNRLVVRVRERKPVAFCVLRGRVFLVDAFGVLLEQPAQARFVLPVLQGVDPEEPESRRATRVAMMQRVQNELGPLAKQVSEINVADLSNVRVVAQAEGRAVELIMGDDEFGKRYQNFLSHYSEIHKHSPAVRVFDLRLDDRITAKE